MQMQRRLICSLTKATMYLWKTPLTGELTTLSNIILNQRLIHLTVYSGSLAGLTPLGCNLVGLETDQHGIVPSELRNTLENWPSDKRRPKV